MSERATPLSTYRLQLTGDFGFDAAADVVPYLARLGVTHLYLSPVLQATPGSTHGYDVVDHTRISADLGGADGLERLAALAHRHGLGVVADVVPNHMAIPAPQYLNRPLWETLRLGRDSPTAHWFDVDWAACDGRLGLPVLGETAADAAAAGDLHVDTYDGAPVLRYHDHVFPVAPGTAGGEVLDVLARQHYVLAHWQDSPEVLNYRRFFDVDTLIAVRVEEEDVFDATHAVLLDLHRRGVIDAFRIDHPDGLADPQGYLDLLRARTGGAWVVVEKILAPEEELPPSWVCAGTTGYDALAAVQTALAPATAEDLARRWQEAGGVASFAAVETAAKRQVVEEILRPEVRRLVRSAVAAAADRGLSLDTDAAGAALATLLTHIDVYRIYLRPGTPVTTESRAALRRLVERAKADAPQWVGPIDVLGDLLADTAAASVAGRDLVVRFQQVCGAVMAKAVEDTALYRWHRLVALNEVGSDPTSLDRAAAWSLHHWAARRQATHPAAMTTLSTHDTKRGEDTRARLLAAADHLPEWDTAWAAVRALAAEHGVDEPTAYLALQTLLGTWPISADRLTGYLHKAAREAKQHTSWQRPDERYEQALAGFSTRCLEGRAADAVAAAVRGSEDSARAVILGAKLLQLTLPGVADVYQGSEMESTTLVDPDNRRPVDFQHRADTLEVLDAEGLSTDASLDAEKLWVVSRALRVRRDHPDAFGPDGAYEPLETTSPHLLGFVRGGRVATVVTRWPSGVAADGWGDVRVPLPPGTWADVLTGRRHRCGDDGPRAADVLPDLPVALLVREERPA